MPISSYIKDKQPILFRTFSNALHCDKLAHAYLIAGDIGQPLKEIGLFLAKSILCDAPNPMACEECTTCQRIERGEYPDLMILDANEASIKKEEINDVVTSFSETPLEKKGIMIYLINKVETLNQAAANALLKFLEEPSPNTVAILTTSNESKVLSTIQSRCQKIRLQSRPRKEILAECQEMGIPEDDSEMLSFFLFDAQSIQEESQEEDYCNAKKALLEFGDSLLTGRDFARFTMEKDVIPLCTAKTVTRYFIEMLTILLKEGIGLKKGEKPNLPSYATISKALAKAIPNEENALLEVMKLRSEVETNISTGLLLLHLVKTIFKE